MRAEQGQYAQRLDRVRHPALSLWGKKLKVRNCRPRILGMRPNIYSPCVKQEQTQLERRGKDTQSYERKRGNKVRDLSCWDLTFCHALRGAKGTRG